MYNIELALNMLPNMLGIKCCAKFSVPFALLMSNCQILAPRILCNAKHAKGQMQRTRLFCYHLTNIGKLPFNYVQSLGAHCSRSLFTKMYEQTDDTFLYFAYGSNLLKKRIRINNASAEFLGIGRLENHQLNFIKYSEHWRGASATIIPTTDSAHIWGAIWRLHVYDMPALDKQEGVDTNWYFAKTVDVITPDGYSVRCRTYQQTVNPPLRKDGDELPVDRRPCITYLDCIVSGAKECELPNYYIEELKKIPNNGQEASPKLIEKLKRE